MAEKIEALVEGGNASAAPPLGPALGPLGVNIGKVVNKINEKTKEFEGIEIPVTVKVDSETKEFEIGVGTPPVSALLKNELDLDKMSPHPKEEKVADAKIEQLIKIAKMKRESMNTNDMKSLVKQIAGTCLVGGILIEGKDPKEVIKEIEEGKYDEEISQEKTELTEEEKKKLEEEREELAKELEERHKEEREKAEAIIKEMEGEEKGNIKAKLREEEIHEEIIDKLLPSEEEEIHEETEEEKSI